MRSCFSYTILCIMLVGGFAAADNPCQSGLKPGQRPGPYSAVISTGPQRGQSYCYICETAERPAIIVFARSPTNTLARLAQKMDRAVADHKKADLRAWITFLNNDQLTFDPQIVKWSQKNALRTLPIGIFEDVGGPPSYRLARDADVTVLLFVKQKVVANFAFREGELKDEQVDRIMKELPKIVSEKK